MIFGKFDERNMNSQPRPVESRPDFRKVVSPAPVVVLPDVPKPE